MKRSVRRRRHDCRSGQRTGEIVCISECDVCIGNGVEVKGGEEEEDCEFYLQRRG